MNTSDYKKIFSEPAYWILVLVVLVKFFLRTIIKDNNIFFYMAMATLAIGLADSFIVIKIQELVGLERMDYLRIIKIRIISTIKLGAFLVALVLSLLFLQALYRMAMISNFSKLLVTDDPLIISYLANVMMIWMTVGENYALFTNNPENLNRRTFNVILNMPKKFFLLIIVYLIILSLGTFVIKTFEYGGVIGSIAVLSIAIPFRIWLFRIFPSDALDPMDAA